MTTETYEEQQIPTETYEEQQIRENRERQRLIALDATRRSLANAEQTIKNTDARLTTLTAQQKQLAALGKKAEELPEDLTSRLALGYGQMQVELRATILILLEEATTLLDRQAESTRQQRERAEAQRDTMQRHLGQDAA